MKAKERVIRTIRNQDTDRPAFGIFGTHLEDERRLMTYCCCQEREDLYRHLGIDIWNIRRPLKYVGLPRTFRGKKADWWGIPLDIDNYSGQGEGRPLSEIDSVDAVEAYAWPDIKDFEPIGFAEDLDEHRDFAINAYVHAPIIHTFTDLCGFENGLMLLAAEPEIASAIIRRIVDFEIAYVQKTLKFAEGRADFVANCNDFGTQISTLISPELFRSLIKPEFSRFYQAIKAFDVYVMQHSCGAIEPLIADFIEIGADILNPLQVTASGMSLDNLKKYKGKICYYGGIDTQYLLPAGPMEKIREVTLATINALQDVSGYIIGPSQGIEPDIPAEHACAMSPRYLYPS